MKKTWIWILIVVVILVVIGGYLGRHSIKAMLGMAPATPAQPTSSPQTNSASSAVPSDNIYKISTDPAKGKYLTDFQGMTLYTFDKDTPGVSNCYDQCAAAWPVYTSGATAQGTFPANISVITRKDHTKQFAWEGMPLYYFAKDTKAGDTTGDGVGDLWHIVKP